MTDKERIDVYVNKLPKTCKECFCVNDNAFCNLYYKQNKEVLDCEYCNKEIHTNCPLKTIQSVQNQVAIEQLEKVKELCDERFNYWEQTEFKGNRYDEYDVSNAYLDIKVNIENIIRELGGKDE